MKTLALLLIITHPPGYGEKVHKYPMPDLATCQSVLRDTKAAPEVAVVTCVGEAERAGGE